MTVAALAAGALGDYVALAAGFTAFAYCAHYAVTRLVPARPGEEE